MTTTSVALSSDYWEHGYWAVLGRGAGAIILYAIVGLVLPNFTVSGEGPTLSALHEVFLIFMSLALYGVFLAMQTLSHRKYFLGPDESTGHAAHPVRSRAWHGACSKRSPRASRRARTPSASAIPCAAKSPRWRRRQSGLDNAAAHCVCW